MTFSPDSPELTAYLLDELDPDTRAALEAAVAASPELAAELNALRQTLGTVSEAFAAEPALGLSPAQHQRVLEAVGPVASERGPKMEPTSARRRSSKSTPLASILLNWLGWRGGFLAAGGLAVLVTLVSLMRPEKKTEATLALTDTLRYQPNWQPPKPMVAETKDAATESKPVDLPANQPTSIAFKVSTAPVSPPAATRDLVAARPTVQLDSLSTAAAPGSAPASVRSLQEVEARFGSAVTSRGIQAGTDAKSAAASSQRWLERSKATEPYYYKSAEPQSAGRRVESLARSESLPSLSLAAPARPESLGQIAAPGNHVTQARTMSESLRAGAMAKEMLASSRWTVTASDRLGSEPQNVLLQQVESLSDTITPNAAFSPVEDNPFHPALTAPLSTFGMDVDTASYSLLRRMLRDQSLPPADAVRLEELLNYFSYEYPQPTGDHPLGATVEVAGCPWNDAHKLVRIGVKAREIPQKERPRSNLVFLLDVSGSMQPETRLPLVKRSMRLLLDRLSSKDSVGIVTYAGEAGVAIPSTAITDEGRQQVIAVLDRLKAGSGTRGSAGIEAAYAMATNQFIKEGVNRVILCTDGDFNLGITDREELLSLITDRAKSGVFLSVLGFGMDNLKDSTLELLADRGNGNYAYIDSFAEARKVLVKQLDGTLVTVAKDAKIQVEFNPTRVAKYRLLGYEKRLLRDRDFNDDTKDAGDVGAGHSVTVLYEIEPVAGFGAGVDPLRYRAEPAAGNGIGSESRTKPVHPEELLNLKIRYKQPDGDRSRLMELPVKDVDHDFAKASFDFKFAAAVAGYGMLLRHSPHAGSLTWEKVLRLAELGQGLDPEGYRAEFIDLARKAQQLSARP
jgi:Ca-activated chloride channel family protein